MENARGRIHHPGVPGCRSDPHSYPNAHGLADAERNADRYGHPDGDGDQHTYSDQYANSNGNNDPDSLGNTQRHALPYADSHPHVFPNHHADAGKNAGDGPLPAGADPLG